MCAGVKRAALERRRRPVLILGVANRHRPSTARAGTIGAERNPAVRRAGRPVMEAAPGNADKATLDRHLVTRPSGKLGAYLKSEAIIRGDLK